MDKEWDEDEDDEDEDESGEYVEQVCDVICPHCKQPLQLVLAPTSEDEDELDDEEL